MTVIASLVEAKQSHRNLLTGIGIDLVDLARAGRLANKGPEALRHILNPDEIRVVQKAKDRVKAFAIHFAAKEAASKALSKTLVHPGMFRDYKVQVKKNRISVFFGQGKDRIRLRILAFSASDGHVGALALP